MTVDLSKLPPPEVIGKHLSPIIMSQRYEEDGYVTESVGPVTFREATIGVAGAAAALFMNFEGRAESGRPVAEWRGTPARHPTPTPDDSAPVSPTPSPF